MVYYIIRSRDRTSGSSSSNFTLKLPHALRNVKCIKLIMP